LFLLVAQHDGGLERRLGEFASLQDAFEFICDESATNEYWMEGCDMVCVELATGRQWYLCDNEWEEL
jgi:hypothetical protein